MDRVVITAGPWPAEDPLLGRLLEEAGARRTAVSSATEVPPTLEGGADLLLCDSALPGVAELVSELRRSERHDLLPVLAAVPDASDGSAIGAYTMGADDFLLASALCPQLLPKLRAALADAVEPTPATMTSSVLLIDPSELHRVVLGKLLRQAGFQVTALADGQAAVAALEDGLRIDLIIVDLGLPSYDPVDLVIRLRSRAGGRLVPAIALTHVGVPDQRALRALTSGIRSVHDKRRPPEDLVFLANEANADAAKNLRASPRLLCSTVVKWRAEGGEWELGLSHNLSLHGLYVRVIDPPARGCRVEAVLKPPGAGEEVTVRARVAWRKDFAARAVRSYPTGMGLAIEEMTERVARAFGEATRLLASGEAR
jgi:CheY-like chemotaxis protein